MSTTATPPSPRTATAPAAGPAAEQPLVALTIAGSDSGGGAGIQADLRAFRFFGVFGTTAITAVTAQNPGAVTDVHPVPSVTVRRQIDAVLAAISVRAVKTGMLFGADIIAAVAEALAAWPRLPLVVDPVMVASSGARLLREDAVAALRSRLLPGATVITPNLPEAEILAGRPLASAAAVVTAARELATRYASLVVVKGGHDTHSPAVDLVSDGQACWRLASPVVAAARGHGTGCTLSAATAAGLARGLQPLDALCHAKAFVLGSLRACRPIGPRDWAMGDPDRLPLDDVVCERL